MDEVAQARGLLTSLLALPPGPASDGSDFMRYDLEWRVADRWRKLAGDDSNVPADMRARSTRS